MNNIKRSRGSETLPKHLKIEGLKDDTRVILGQMYGKNKPVRVTRIKRKARKSTTKKQIGAVFTRSPAFGPIEELTQLICNLTLGQLWKEDGAASQRAVRRIFAKRKSSGGIKSKSPH